MEYALLAIVGALVAALLWHTNRSLQEAEKQANAVLIHAQGTAEFLAKQQTAVLALVERIVNPPVTTETGRPDITEEEIAAAYEEIPWDATDADPFLADPEYARFVPRQQFNDAPPVATHPMGIPGLSVPWSTSTPSMANDPNGTLRTNGHTTGATVDL